MTRLVALLALAAALVVAAPAGAAVVSYTPGYSEPAGIPPEESCSRYMQCPGPTMTVVDPGAERNDLSIEASSTAIVVRDAAAPLESDPDCTQGPDGSVTCPAGAVITVNAGGGDDRVFAPGVSVTGGEGDDHLTAPQAFGGAGSDTLVGSGPLDTLEGGPGVDVVDAGSGDDIVSEDDDDGSPDRLDGGEGNDLVTFGRRTTAVGVDLGAVPQEAGSAGEGNAVAGFERAAGGRGDDRLVARDGERVQLDGGSGNDQLVAGSGQSILIGGQGSDDLTGGPRFDVLYGGTGDDRLTGRAGNDRLYAGLGDDRLHGGTGADQLVGGSGLDLVVGGSGGDSVFAQDRQRDRVSCGTGRDFAQVDRRERTRSCERVSRPRRSRR